MVKDLAKSLKIQLEEKNYEGAQQSFVEAVKKNQEQFFIEIKKMGCFRPSTYNFDTKALAPLIKSAFQKPTRDLLGNESLRYLESILCLIHLAHGAFSIFKKMCGKFKDLRVQNYLVSLELLFLTGHHSDDPQHPETIENISREEFAEAFSYLFYHYSNSSYASSGNLLPGNVRSIESQVYVRHLVDIFKLVRLRECEVLIDCFGYDAVKKKSEIHFLPRDPGLMRSIEYGFIYQKVQFIHSAFVFQPAEEVVSFDKASSYLCKRLKDIFFTVKKKPLERIVMGFPMVEPLKKIITQDQLFKEEVTEILSLSKELLINPEEISKKQISGALTGLDIIKWQRLIRFSLHMLIAYAKEQKLLDTLVFIQSLVPVFSRENFKGWMEYFFGKQKTEDLMRVACWSSTSDMVFDIQYQPLVFIKGWMLLPPAIVSYSNLVRNFMQNVRFRFDPDSAQDPLGEILEKSLKPRASHLKRGLTYEFEGKHGEIDLVAVIDGCIFYFECKNSLFPCNHYELRTSYDYIRKAATQQLEQLKKNMQNPEFIKMLARKIGIKSLDGFRFSTCVVMGNRMFSGGRVLGHPVRSVFELVNFLNSGEVSFHEGNIRKSTKRELFNFKVWHGEEFCSEDLIDYLEKDLMHEPVFRAMKEVKQIISLGSRKMVVPIYRLDTGVLLKEYCDRFRSTAN